LFARLNSTAWQRQKSKGRAVDEIIDLAEKRKALTEFKVGNANLQASDLIKRGQAVLPRLECNLVWGAEWHDLILALGFGRDLATRTAGTNQPQGSKYTAVMGPWLRCYGFDRIDPAERSRLLECYVNLDAINAWRSALPAKQQKKLNHPRTVLAHWKRSLHPNNGNKESAPPAATITIDAVIAWLATAKLSPNERAQIVETLPTVVADDIIQRAVAQAREVAEQEKAALAKCVASIRATLKTKAPAVHQIEAARAAIRRLDRAMDAPWEEQMAPGSLFKPALDPDQEALLQLVGRGKAPTDSSPVAGAPPTPTKH
jgi:hypothetical protein